MSINRGAEDDEASNNDVVKASSVCPADDPETRKNVVTYQSLSGATSQSVVVFYELLKPTEALKQVDLDEAVLTDGQKWRLSFQCLKTGTFWKLYLMQACTIRKWPP